ncbi:MFS general substrate transporter [Melanogaster broomeanus]|nr:MFS general substrate transporter [Melanogaster broomeanus]
MSTAPTVTSQTPSDDPKNATASPLKLTDQTNLLPFRKILAVFSGLALCVVVTVIDSAIEATALPTISAAFNAGSVASWVPSAYMLTSTSFQPLYGRFSDIFGRKAVLCVAMVIFMLGSLASGFARSINELIVFRGVAGVGGGSVLSLTQIIMSDVVSLRDRGKYQGIIGGVVAVGYAIGPPLGGVLSEKASWRWCFWINIPVSLCAMCIVVFVLPLKPVEGDVKRQARIRDCSTHVILWPIPRKLLAIDYLGAALTLLGSTLVILPLIWGGVTFPWNSPVVLAPLCSGVLVITLFCWWEWKGADLPIVPRVYIATFINGFIVYSLLYYLPQFFQVALGYSPIQSGIFSLPVLVTEMLLNWVAGMITIVYTGFSVLAVGCGCLSTVTVSTSKVPLVFYMLVAGVGVGQTMQTTTVAAQASVPRKDMSVVTAVRNFIRLLGGTLALAVGSTLINNSLRNVLSTLSLTPSATKAVIDNPTILGSHASSSQLASLGLTSSQAAYALLHGYTAGFRILFILNACLASVATITSIFMIKHKELTRGDEERLRAEARQELESSGRGNKGASVPSLHKEDPEPGNAMEVDLEMGSVEPKEKNSVDLLPGSTFDIEDRKRAYSDKESRGADSALEWFYANFDKEGFSVWRVDFKYNEELAVAFESSNQIGGFFNRLEAPGKYLFASVGVLGEPNAAVVSGALILRGQDVKAVVACAPDWDSYDYKKLHLESEEDKKFFEACMGSGD